jgi:hypothetical protein
MYICVGQKTHNIIVRKKGSQYYIYYLFSYRENKIRKKEGERERELRTQVTRGKTGRKPKPT